MNSTAGRPQVGLIHRPLAPTRPEFDFVNEIVRHFQITTTFDRLPRSRDDLAALNGLDAVIVFWPYRDLARTEPLHMSRLRTRAVMLEHDAFGDFTTWGSLQGTWKSTFTRHEFELLVCSGVRSEEHFSHLGVQTAVVHKGYSPTRFHDLTMDRAGLCTYGAPYPSRVALQRALRHGRVPLTQITAPYSELNLHLNRSLAMVTTVRGSEPRFGSIGKAIQRARPSTLVRTEPAPEPMMKHFEAAGAGLAVFTDPTRDLAVLGFIEGTNVVTFHDLNDLVDKTRYWLARPDQLRQIGANAGALAATRHTWAHRAAELERAIFSP